MTIRIAMWSGPRNISTAMMRSWENRSDTHVIDEPLYAYYLKQTKIKHPGYQQVIKAQSTDWQQVVKELTDDAHRQTHRDTHKNNPINNKTGQTIFYQKHMSQHILPEVKLDWVKNMRHCFLIRNPAEVIASFSKVVENVTQDSIGIQRQSELYQEISDICGIKPLIIDSKDVLQAPKKILIQLCEYFKIPFQENMLSWPVGARKSDGVWAEHWYNNVEQSTNFSGYIKKELSLNPAQKDLAEEAMPFYSQMYEQRLRL